MLSGVTSRLKDWSPDDVTAEPPADRSWGMRDFVITAGVLWRIGQNRSDANKLPAHQERCPLCARERSSYRAFRFTLEGLRLSPRPCFL
jgi:hypothetical protein